MDVAAGRRIRSVRLWTGLAFVVALAATLVFVPVLGFDFVSFDDWKLVRDNPFLREGLSAAGIARAFAEPYYLNWIPLTTLSYHLDAALYGSDPRGFHATNLALHAIASVLLFVAFARATGAPWPSAFVACVFAVHPLHVEPVAWISSRKDVLSGVFFAATLLAHVRHAEAPSAGRYALVWIAATAGLLAKPMLVTLPFVLLLLDAWPLGRLRAASGGLATRVILEKLPLLAPVAGIAAVTYGVQDVVAQGGHSLTVRSLNALDAIGAYLRTSVWPSGLAALYPHPGAAVPVSGVFVGGALLLAGSALSVVLRGRVPAVAVGWLWFLGMLAPVLGFVEVGLQSRADRYMYLPLVGLSMMLAWGAASLAERGPAWRRGVGAAGAVAILVLGIAAQVQLGHWRDSESLYRRALAVTEGNFVAHYGLAGVYAERGAFERARAELEAAVRANPQWPLPYERWAQLELHRGNVAAAREVYDALLALRPGDAGLHAGVADLALRAGEGAAAVRHYAEASRLRPGWLEPLHQLAWLRATHPDATLRDPARSIQLAETALGASRIRDPALIDALAAGHAAAGDFERAATLAVEAASLATTAGDRVLASAIAQRRDGYAQGRPHRAALPLSPRPPLADPGDAPLR